MVPKMIVCSVQSLKSVKPRNKNTEYTNTKVKALGDTRCYSMHLTSVSGKSVNNNGYVQHVQ